MTTSDGRCIYTLAVARSARERVEDAMRLEAERRLDAWQQRRDRNLSVAILAVTLAAAALMVWGVL